MTSWRASLKLRKEDRTRYDATHDRLAAEIENDRLEEAARRVPEERYALDGGQDPYADETRAERRARERQEIRQCGMPH